MMKRARRRSRLDSMLVGTVLVYQENTMLCITSNGDNVKVATEREKTSCTCDAATAGILERATMPNAQ